MRGYRGMITDGWNPEIELLGDPFLTYISWDTRAESCNTSSSRFYKSAHGGVISCKSALDKETSKGLTVTSSRESHCMGGGKTQR